MPKAVKRVIRKKKQVKKSIHDKLKKRNNSNIQSLHEPLMNQQRFHLKPENEFSMNQLSNQPAVPAKELINSETSFHAKNLRNLLITRAMGMNPIGFFPQQYGNINEQRMRELQQNNQTMTNKNSQDKVTIDSFCSENRKLETENKQRRKSITHCQKFKFRLK